MPTRFRLSRLLIRAGISQGQLSRTSGVSLSTVNRLATNSTTRVDLHTLDRLSAALGCEPGDLIKRKRRKKSKEK